MGILGALFVVVAALTLGLAACGASRPLPRDGLAHALTGSSSERSVAGVKELDHRHLSRPPGGPAPDACRRRCRRTQPGSGRGVADDGGPVPARPGSGGEWRRAHLVARAEDVREAALRLAEADAAAVDEVAAAYALPRSTEAERGRRAAAIADALLAAARPPAELITVGAELVGLCERMAEVGSGALLADVAAAADAAAAGLSISRTNVEADIGPAAAPRRPSASPPPSSPSTISSAAPHRSARRFGDT